MVNRLVLLGFAGCAPEPVPAELDTGEIPAPVDSATPDPTAIEPSCPYADNYTVRDASFEGYLDIVSDGPLCLVSIAVYGVPAAEEIRPGCGLFEILDLGADDDVWTGTSTTGGLFCNDLTPHPYPISGVVFQRAGLALKVTTDESILTIFPSPVILDPFDP